MRPPHRSPSRRTILRALAATTAAGGIGAVAGCLGELYETADIETVGSVEQFAILDREPEATVTLVDADDETAVATGTTDSNGAYLFRNVTPGSYVVRDEMVGEESEPVTVMAPDEHPNEEFYEAQTLEEGDGYIETRDGTTLDCQVVFPDGDGPFPTVIDYSGYEPANTFYDSVDSRFTALGYAVVGVNIRGTGCSGGAFDYFERLQGLDGYDMVETVAAQTWADGVALVGKSYPGISQLYVAAENPPSLDAIVPGHVVDDFYRGVVYPGGIKNEGFAVDWATVQQLRIHNDIHRWVTDRIEQGDDVCARNQRLRRQSPHLVSLIEEHDTDDELWSDRRAWELVPQIRTPTLLVNSWQDEQTGGRPANLLARFDEDVPVRFIGCNGDHDEYFGETVFADIHRFLSYYLENEVPDGDAAAFDSFEEARTAYEAEQPYRVYWEVGAGEGHDLAPTGHVDFDSWPPTEAVVNDYYLAPDGTLDDAGPSAGDGEATYTNAPRGSLGDLDDWSHPPADECATFLSSTLEEPTPLLGPVSVTLWVDSDADDVDVCAVLSEVRESGDEVYVQPGWLRASHRAEDETYATELMPWHAHTTDVIQEHDGLAQLRVELFPVGHIFRPGSQIKLTVQAPGGNRDLWAFDALEEASTVTIAHGEAHPSRVSLPILEGIDVPTGAPPCGSLQNQPCRDHPGA